VHQLVVKKFSTLFDARCNHEVKHLFTCLHVPVSLILFWIQYKLDGD